MAIALWMSAAQADPAAPYPLPAELAAAIGHALDRGSIPGAAAVLLDARGVVSAGFFGFADADRREAVTSATCWRVGSLTKTFTALLALRTEQRDPGFLDRPAGPAAPGCERGATPREWLEHTSGGAGSTPADYAEQWPDAPVANAAARAAARPARFCPGMHYAYSNPGYSQAAAAIETTWGEPFDATMHREVFEPLGMHSASLSTRRHPRCLAQSVDAGGRLVARWALADRAAGALTMSALDIAGLARALGADPAGRDDSRFGPSLSSMVHGRTGLGARSTGLPATYGLGLFQFVSAGHLFEGHWGRIDGFQTTFGWHRGAGRGFLVVVNGADRATMHRLRELLARHVVSGVATALPPPPAGPIDPAWAGWYANVSHDMALRAPVFEWIGVQRLRIADDGRHAWLGRPGAERPLFAQGPAALREEALPVPTIALAIDPDGRRHLIDGESHRQLHGGWVALRLFALALAILGPSAVVAMTVAIGLRAIWRRRVLPSSRGPTSREPAAASGLRWGAAGLLVTFAGATWILLLGGTAGVSAPGSPGPIAAGLAAASLVGPACVAWGCWQVRHHRRHWAIAAALAVAAGVQAKLGWWPLVLW